MIFLRADRPIFSLALLSLFVAAQVSIGPVFGQRNFVTGITPVIGPRGGVVGGISIDAEGVVSRAEVNASARLARERALAVGPVASAAGRASPMRKISLRRLEQELLRLQEANLSLPGEVVFLAGVQRIEFIFVDPENKDIILAGPAEGWRVAPSGFVVGDSSGLPVIDICDMLMALRTDRSESFQGITCSMDATQSGLKKYSDFLRGRQLEFNEETLESMRHAIGNFEVTFTGVQANSHFARVLIAADLMMKRLGMNLENSPVRGVTSYVEMLQKSRQSIVSNISPRWWLAADYEPVLRDSDGLAWKIRGPAVKAMTGEDFLSRDGQKTTIEKPNPLAQKWADDFTKHYSQLSVELPVFGQLRNCMDLAVVAALLSKNNLFAQAGFDSSALLNPETIRLAEYPVPQFTPPQISHARNRKGWIVTLSGGVDIDGWSVASNTEIDTDLPATYRRSLAYAGATWWWD